MKIEIWSDVTCPWCGISHHRLEKALAQFEHRAQVEVVHRSYELDPSSPRGARPVRAALREKHGLTDAALDAALAPMEAMAAAEGLSPYILGDNFVGNTALAHEFLAFASERGLEDAAWKRVFRAYFGEGRSVFDVDSLVELGVELGLPADEARSSLADRRFRTRIESDAREARALGASGVPFLLIDRRRTIAGAQSVETLLDAMTKSWRENPPALDFPEGAICGPDGCVGE